MCDSRHSFRFFHYYLKLGTCCLGRANLDFPVVTVCHLSIEGGFVEIKCWQHLSVPNLFSKIYMVIAIDKSWCISFFFLLCICIQTSKVFKRFLWFLNRLQIIKIFLDIWIRGKVKFVKYLIGNSIKERL
jgi:hypothetical protein